ncbi:MAG: methylmalonyl-CoA mutase family protein [Vulcanimicrobiota bacterium]
MWSEFSIPSLDEWLALVAKEAGGKTVDQLCSQSWEGLTYRACCEPALASSASSAPATELAVKQLQPDDRPSQIQAAPVLRGPLGMPALLALAEHFPQVKALEIDLSQFLEHNQSLEGAPAGLEIRFTSQSWVNQGADSIHELAWSMAGLIEVMRRLAEPPQAVLALKLCAGPRLLLEIARLRAARQLWDTVCRGYGLDWPARIHLIQDARYLTLQDPHNNLLRSTLAASAGLLGGATSIELLPCDASPEAGRRAENVLRLLREESRLGLDPDPLAGSGLVEDLTQQLAEAAWKEVQRIEGAGGLAVQKDLWALARDQRLRFEDQLRRDRQGLVGVNRYVASAAFAADPPALTYAPAPPVSLDKARQLIAADAPLHQTGLLPPLEKLRWSEAFEEVMRRGRGKKLDVLVLGQPGPELKSRQSYLRNWLSLAGIEPIFHHHQTPDGFSPPAMWMLCCEDDGPDYKVSLNPPALVGKPPHNYEGVAVHSGCNRVYCLEQLLDRMS